jgi:hypothetical protein
MLQETGEEHPEDHHHPDDHDHGHDHDHDHDHEHEHGKHEHSHDHSHGHGHSKHGALGGVQLCQRRSRQRAVCLNPAAACLHLDNAPTYPSPLLRCHPLSWLRSAAHKHDDRVSSCGFEIEGDMDMKLLNAWLSKLLKVLEPVALQVNTSKFAFAY